MSTSPWAIAQPSNGVAVPIVEVEEEVYTVQPADNGAGPMWCFGNTCIVRHGDQVMVSALETVADAKPLNNCVPFMLLRNNEQWETVFRSAGRTREPSPMAVFADGSVFLSVNPTTTSPDTYAGPAQPAVLKFTMSSPKSEPVRLMPIWHGEPPFTEHSYRSFAADGMNREMILMQNIGYTHAEWSFCDRSGTWSANGSLDWPQDASTGEPIRLCYPAVALDSRRVFVLGVSDIVEPNREWLRHKRELTGREWDYVFRRLFFTWADDITSGNFHDWIEISNREATAGSMFPNDLFVGANGDISLLWTETAVDTRLRDRFFADSKQRQSLEYAVMRRGEVIHRSAVLEWNEGEEGLVPGRGRFHVTPDGQLWVFCYVSGIDEQGQSVSRNQISKVHAATGVTDPVVIELRHPLPSVFTNSARAGCAPSNILDLLGQVGDTMRYARIRLE